MADPASGFMQKIKDMWNSFRKSELFFPVMLAIGTVILFAIYGSLIGTGYYFISGLFYPIAIVALAFTLYQFYIYYPKWQQTRKSTSQTDTGTTVSST